MSLLDNNLHLSSLQQQVLKLNEKCQNFGLTPIVKGHNTIGEIAKLNDETCDFYLRTFKLQMNSFCGVQSRKMNIKKDC